MRKLFFALLCLTIGTTLSSQIQDKTIQTVFPSNGYTDHGGYGALVMKYNKVLDQEALWLGVRGGWLIDHQVTIGLAAYGLVSPIENDEWLPENPSENQVARLVTGYGGLLIEPIVLYKKPFHIALPIVIGAGGASYAIQTNTPGGGTTYSWPYDTEVFFALEPGIEVEINVLRFMRVNIGGAYLYTSNVTIPEVASDFLRGWNWQFAIKFGGF